MSDLKFIFVHGAGGWGSYDKIDRWLPYWGMFGHDILKYLRNNGFDCYAASVAPSGSLWVRACELYAQLTGTRTDYGKVHSDRDGRTRYGKDFTGDPLIPEWDDKTRLVLLGHSMGGGTVQLLAHLLANGDKEEQDNTPAEELSGLFTGGKGKHVHSIVTLASPLNGSASADMMQDPSFDLEKVKIPYWSRAAMRMLSLRLNVGRKKPSASVNRPRTSGIDPAIERNKWVQTLPYVYYFSVPCCSTKQGPDGLQHPIASKTEILYYARSVQIGAYPGGITPGGYVIDASWQENDGLVSTISARAPFGAPQKAFDRDDIEKGIWQVFPTFDGDHMSVQGGFFIRRDMRGFYKELLEMIEGLDA